MLRNVAPISFSSLNAGTTTEIFTRWNCASFNVFVERFSFCFLAGQFLPSPVVSEQFTLPINAATRLCAVYGWPIKHSASPAMHNAAMTALGLNWRYLAFEVHPDDLRAAIHGARAMRFAGVNLTVPHKLLAVELMDALDDSAREWGAVNTVRFEGQD